MEHRKRAKGLTVVFSTYQSLPTVADAQALGVDAFDLVVCDESHRTCGVTLAGDDGPSRASQSSVISNRLATANSV